MATIAPIHPLEGAPRGVPGAAGGNSVPSCLRGDPPAPISLARAAPVDVSDMVDCLTGSYEELTAAR